MDYTGIISNATKLKKNGLYKVTVSDATREALMQINSSIQRAHDAGLSKIVYPLPIHFRQIDNSVPNSEIQTAVYYNIISELEKNDYSLHITFHKATTDLEVSWSVRAGIGELESMRNKIISLTRKS